MNKLVKVIEKYLLPIADVVQSNKYLDAVRLSFIALMPFLIVGSTFLLLASFPIPHYEEFLGNLIGPDNIGKLYYVFDVTYNLMALLIVIMIGVTMAEKLKLGHSAILLPVVSFMLLVPSTIMLDDGSAVGGAFALHYFDATSMFVAIIVGISTVVMFDILDKKKFTIKLPENVPPEVFKSFSALIPAFTILIFWLVVKIGFEMTTYQTFVDFVNTILQKPLLALGNTLPAQMLSELLISTFWFLGLHGDSIVSSVMGPVWQALSAENLAATQAGLEPVNLISQQFRDVFLIAGGTGFTLSLLLAIFVGAKSKTLRSVAKISAPAALFNINEPIIFGLPIVLNPIMAIPFIITPLVLCVITYFAMATGLVPPTNGVAIPWTTPIFISGFLTTGIQGVILQAVNLAVAFAIYFPFIKVLDKQYLEEEAAAEQA